MSMGSSIRWTPEAIVWMAKVLAEAAKKKEYQPQCQNKNQQYDQKTYH